MALETVNIIVNSSAYVAVGANVTALTMTEFKVGNMRVHVVAAGGSAPSPSAAYQEFSGEYSYSGSSADIYVMSPLGPAVIGVVRK